MANFSIQNIAIKGISASVPAHKEFNTDYTGIAAEEMQKFMDATGVQERRVVAENICTSDLCFEAATKLLQALQWDSQSVEVLIFVSQSPDYKLPITAAILQDRLNISKECIAFDIPLGCSGYVYGLSVLSGLMQSFGLKRGLLLAGETSSKIVSPTDKSTKPLFGDAGSATALEVSVQAKPMHFHLGTDGSGYKAIMIPYGGFRNLPTANSLKCVTYEPGIERNQHHLILDGMDVFAFGITQAPKTVQALLQHHNLDINSINYFVFHQANLKMNKMIAKKLKLEEAKVPYSLKHFGNTSSASIPLTIISEIKEAVNQKNVTMLLCGFGVGLSWGTVFLEADHIICLPLIEVP